ncbi:MAG TPA: hypothetical protein VI540_03685 [Gaiellaceae bacterium]|nr:hypothetical protein [Gaiellaceae bacterium]
MPSITFAAPIIRSAIASLQANLPTQIAAFNAEPENEVTLTAPVAFHFGAADPLIEFPAIEVAATDGATAQWAIDRSEGDHFPQIAVVIWFEGERGEIGPTYEASLGMARCVLEVLSQTGAFGEAEIPNDAGAVTWRTDVLPADLTEDGREFSKWRCAVLLVFRLETVERFG